MTGVLFACVAGLFLGGLNVTMRRGIARVADIDAGSAVIATVAFVVAAALAVVFGAEFDAGELWPFLVLGIFVPGLSQLVAMHAVQAAGASRAGILFGMAPLFSAVIAIVAFSEPLRWPLVAGTLLVVAGGAALVWEGKRPADYRAYGAALAVGVAVAFGLRDNLARAVTRPLPPQPTLVLGTATSVAQAGEAKKQIRNSWVAGWVGLSDRDGMVLAYANVSSNRNGLAAVMRIRLQHRECNSSTWTTKAFNASKGGFTNQGEEATTSRVPRGGRGWFRASAVLAHKPRRGAPVDWQKRFQTGAWGDCRPLPPQP